MKSTYYFSHDYDAREDDKIKKLIFEMGYEGYGIYWAIIETLYHNDGYIDNECERIAFALHTQCEKINKVVNDFNLFKINDKKIFSESVLHRLKKIKGKSLLAKKAAKIRWGKEEVSYADALHPQCKRNAINENKINENKINNNNIIIKEHKDIYKIVKEYLLNKNNMTRLDGNEEDNLNACSVLINILKKDFPKTHPIIKIKELIDKAVSDEFQKKLLVSFMYLLKHWVKINNIQNINKKEKRKRELESQGMPNDCILMVLSQEEKEGKYD